MRTLRLFPIVLLIAAAILSGCVTAPPPGAVGGRPSPATNTRAAQAVARLVEVASRMEPQIESECRARTTGRNCDYRLVIDDRLDEPPNAFQTEDRAGRPVIGVTLAMLAEVRNSDELAFVFGHEAAHHIAGHIASRQRDAAIGAVFLGRAAQAQGADARAVRQAQQLGAELGSRLYSKDYELEADRLGTIITWNAGYDPLKGAAFFLRLPDPKAVLLGTHPPNQLRFDVVRETVAELRRKGR